MNVGDSEEVVEFLMEQGCRIIEDEFILSPRYPVPSPFTARSTFAAMGLCVQKEVPAVPKYIIEREVPGAGKLSQQQLQAISQKSCSVLNKLGSQIQWLHSYVVDDKIYCVYIAPDEEMIREHARQGGFPANRISEVSTMIDPTTGGA